MPGICKYFAGSTPIRLARGSLCTQGKQSSGWRPAFSQCRGGRCYEWNPCAGRDQTRAHVAGRSRIAGRLLAQSVDELILGHGAVTTDTALTRNVFELILGATLVARGRIAGALGTHVLGATLFTAVFINGAGGDLLRAILGFAP